MTVSQAPGAGRPPSGGSTPHVLVIAYHFPPAGGVPVRRVLRVLRHLPVQGLRCSVLTADRPYDPYHGQDPAGVDSLPATAHIVRAAAHSGAERGLAALWHLSGALRRRWQPRSGAGPTTADMPVQGAGPRRWLQDRVLFPDPKRAWAKAAVPAFETLHRADPVDAVWATGYPWSSFWLARELGRSFGIPYALDYRDGWTANPRGVWDTPRQLALERELVEGAGFVTAATDWLRDDVNERFAPRMPAETMTNGYDAAEYPRLDRTLLDPERCIVTYTGTFNDAWPPSPADQSPWWLLQAIGRLDTGTRAALRVRLVGRVPVAVRDAVAQRGLGDVVDVVGPVSHGRALAHQVAADHLLLIVSDGPRSGAILTGKLVEYAGARRPVLALVPEGEARRVVEKFALGRVVGPREVDAIASVLARTVSDWRAVGRPPDAPVVAELSASVQVARLAAALQRMIEG